MRISVHSRPSIQYQDGMELRENDKRLQTTPEDWKYKSIKWIKSSCAVALNTTYGMSKLVKFSPTRADSLLEKLKQELAPEYPGFRTLCSDEPRTGVEIVFADLHKSYVNSSYINLFWPNIPAKTTEILAKDASKMNKKRTQRHP